MSSLILSALMIGAFLLLFGAVVLWRRGERQKAALMLVAALVFLVNVLIWTIPITTAQTTIAP